MRRTIAMATSRHRNPLNARSPVPSGRGPLARGGPRWRLVALRVLSQPCAASRYDFTRSDHAGTNAALDASGHASVMLHGAHEGSVRPGEWRHRQWLAGVGMHLLREDTRRQRLARAPPQQRERPLEIVERRGGTRRTT